MKKILLFCLFLGGISLKAKCQENDLANKIMTYADSSRVFIENGRLMIADHVKDRDYQEAIKVASFIQKQKMVQGQMLLFSWEELILNLLANEMGQALKVLSTSQSCTMRNFSIGKDFLGENLMEKWVEEYLFIDEKIKEVENPTDQEVLFIAMDWLKGADDSVLHSEVVEFRKKYPSSPYDGWLNKWSSPIRSWSIGFSLGGGKGGFGGDVGKLFEDFTEGRMDMDLTFNKVVVGLYFQGDLDMKSIEPVEVKVNGNWEEVPAGRNINYLDYGLHLGYMAQKSRRIRSYPFVSIGGSSFNLSTEDYEDVEDNEISSSFSMGLGASSELTLKRWKHYTVLGQKEEIWFGIKGTLGINKHFGGKDPFKGTHLYAQLSLFMRLTAN